jgi:small-conductance mechanosensitive channel
VESVVADVGRSVMRDVAGGVDTFEPFVRFHTFGESSIDFTVIPRAREFTDQCLVKREFVKRLHSRFDHEGIVIPVANRTLDHRSPAPAEDVGRSVRSDGPTGI